MLPSIPNGPAHVRRIGLGPPAIELRQIQSAVDQHFHAAGSARLPRPPRRVDPHVHSRYQLLSHIHVVVAEKDNAGARLGAANELMPLPDHGLSCWVLWMRF